MELPISTITACGVIIFSGIILLAYKNYNHSPLNKYEIQIIREYINTQHILKQTIEKVPKLAQTVEHLLKDMKKLDEEILRIESKIHTQPPTLRPIIKGHTERLVQLQSEVKEYAQELNDPQNKWCMLKSQSVSSMSENSLVSLTETSVSTVEDLKILEAEQLLQKG